MHRPNHRIHAADQHQHAPEQEALTYLSNHPGEPLDPQTRATFEPHFNHHFGDVRIYSDTDAATLATNLDANAFTLGNRIVFNHDMYQPATPKGQSLLAHELAHTVQQQGTELEAVTSPIGRTTPHDTLEHQAKAAATPLWNGSSGSLTTGTGATIARDERGSADAEPWVEPLEDNPFDKLNPDPLADIDENPVNWTRQVFASAPPDPFVLLDCAVEDSPPPAPRVKGQQRAPRNEHPSHHRRKVEFDFEGIQDMSRRTYWRAFQAVTSEAQATHTGIASEVTAYNHAERDPELRSLLFMLPNNDRQWKGDLDDLAQVQQVPGRGGVSVGSLFESDGDLQLNKHDRRAIESTAKATQSGKGGRKTERATGKTVDSDAALAGAVETIQGALAGAREKSGLLRAAGHAIEVYKANNEAADVQRDIEALKQEVATVKEIVGTIFDVATTIAHIAKGDVGDAIDKVGVIAGTLLSHMNDGRIARAEAKLEQANERAKTARGQELQERLHAAKNAVSKALSEVQTAKTGLLRTLTARRESYNALGIAAGSEIDCPTDSRHKISGMLAAIPIVETVVSRARNIAEKSVAPNYNTNAGKGFAMAQYARHPKVSVFLTALGQVAHSKYRFAAVANDWEHRLRQLQDVKRKITGARPAD
jgi:Domain of unknown function (DUF4157)